jgi:hypothetical protein
MSDVAIITVQTTRWLTEMEVINRRTPETRYLFIGRVDHMEHTVAVAESGTSATRFYCEIHKTVFRILDQCSECAGASISNVQSTQV